MASPARFWSSWRPRSGTIPDRDAGAERAGAASAISETGSELGGALGIAVLGSIGTAVYRGVMAVPDGIPPDAMEAAQRTLGGAVEVAGGLPGHLGAELLGAAREAFTQAFELTAVVCAALALAAAIATAPLLRDVGPSPEVMEAAA
jgi:DHA2 family multidrug resistance protein-like MFS transporter